MTKPTRSEVEQAQATWARYVVERKVEELVALYDFSEPRWSRERTGSPRGTARVAFNPTLDDAFVADEAGTRAYFEGTSDKPGFAKKGWTRVWFSSTAAPKGHPRCERFITTYEGGAVAVGRYVFERESAVMGGDGKPVLAVTRQVVDYTFVYVVVGKKLLIAAHHSSLPLAQG